MNIKTTLAILTIITVNSNATQYHLGYPSPTFVAPNFYGVTMNDDLIHSNQWGYGIDLFGASQIAFDGRDYMTSLGLSGIKQWTHSSHMSAEIKIGAGWLHYGDEGFADGSPGPLKGSYSRNSLYARIEPSYHFWWNDNGIKIFTIGQYSRRGFDYGAGLGLVFRWETK